jgi:hypothetical protein
MKRLLFLCFAICFLYACSSNSNTESSAADTTAAAKSSEAEKAALPAITYPYTATYSSDFKVGDPNHAKALLDLYTMWDAGKVSDMRSFFADSIDLTFSDGTHFKGGADSILKEIAKFRGSYKSVTSKVQGWLPVHSNDKNEDWVLIWAREIRTSNKGKTDSSDLHEIWHVKNGKFDLAFQYNQAIPKN